MKVLSVSKGRSILIAPRHGFGMMEGDSFILRWCASRKPGHTAVGIEGPESVWSISEIDDKPLSGVFRPRELALYPQYAAKVTLIHRGLGAEAGPMLVGWMENHHPKSGGNILALSFDPDFYAVAPVYAAEHPKARNRGRAGV